MYGDFLLLEQDNEQIRRAERLAIGQTSGRDEKWLRDTLFRYPELLPIADIDPSYGPLVPLCRELRTAAGPIDLAYISPHGRLTLVECKLWRNPEARRKVVAQVLDYARAISHWTYADLQRQVAIATGSKGNVPFKRAVAVAPGLAENRFVDAAYAAMVSGRFLLVIAGDGIREEISGISELIDRNAASGFSLALVEVGLYGMADGALIVQPRTLARTQLIERTVVMVREQGTSFAASLAVLDDDESACRPEMAREPERLSNDDEFRAWWISVEEMQFDDPEQELPKYHARNCVKARLPIPNIWLTAYRDEGNSGEIGVYNSGTGQSLKDVFEHLRRDADEITAELPFGSELAQFKRDHIARFITKRSQADFPDDDAKRRWLAETLNAYANVFRPRLKRSLAASLGD